MLAVSDLFESKDKTSVNSTKIYLTHYIIIFSFKISHLIYPLDFLLCSLNWAINDVKTRGKVAVLWCPKWMKVRFWTKQLSKTSHRRIIMALPPGTLKNSCSCLIFWHNKWLCHAKKVALSHVLVGIDCFYHVWEWPRNSAFDCMYSIKS